MNNKLILLISIFLMATAGCIHQDQQSEISKSKQAVELSNLNNASLDELILQPNVYTWKEIDYYYRNKLANSGDMNHKNSAFHALVELFQVDKKAPVEVVEYYINEQLKVDFSPFAKEFRACLDALTQTWPEEKIKETARNRYMKTESYYARNTKWTPKWEKDKTLHQCLLEKL